MSLRAAWAAMLYPFIDEDLPMTHQATDTASAALLAKWRLRAEKAGRIAAKDPSTFFLTATVAGWLDEVVADLLASLPAPAAPRGTDRAEDKKPLPPDVLADALQDRISPTSGRLRDAVAVKLPAPAAPEEEKSFSYREGES